MMKKKKYIVNNLNIYIFSKNFIRETMVNQYKKMLKRRAEEGKLTTAELKKDLELWDLDNDLELEAAVLRNANVNVVSNKVDNSNKNRSNDNINKKTANNNNNKNNSNNGGGGNKISSDDKNNYEKEEKEEEKKSGRGGGGDGGDDDGDDDSEEEKDEKDEEGSDSGGRSKSKKEKNKKKRRQDMLDNEEKLPLNVILNDYFYGIDRKNDKRRNHRPLSNEDAENFTNVLSRMYQPYDSGLFKKCCMSQRR